MAFTYNGMQYREDGAPLDASGNVTNSPWVNPAIANLPGQQAAGQTGWGVMSGMGQGTQGADGSLQNQGRMFDAASGAMIQPQIAQQIQSYVPPTPAAPTPWGGDSGGVVGGGQFGGAAYSGSSASQPSPQVMGASGGMGSTGSGNGSSQTNPYLQGMADNIGRQSQQQLGQAFNQIRSNSIGVGGLGGSRQGVAQGVATGMANDAYQGNMANLYGTQYNADANRSLQQYQGDQSFYTAQRGQDQTGAALGANLVTQGQNGQWGPINQANGVYGNYTGFGNNTTTNQTGGGAQGVLGGALGAAQLGQNMGWWGGSGTQNTNAATNNSSITGVGSPYDYTGQSWF